MSASERNQVPLEVLHVPLFERKWVKYFERPQAKAFLVRSTVTLAKVKLWWTREGYAELKKHYTGLPAFDENSWHGGFIEGRQLVNPCVPVFTCAGLERPPILYRVVHEQQPYYGLKARGYGSVKITPTLFQAFVDKHLNWRTRNLSPFISVTDSWSKVQHIKRLLQERGGTGLRIVVFRSSGPGWNHKRQRLFHVPLLGKYLRDIDYRTTNYMQAEYLLESHIPQESILKIIRVKEEDDRCDATSLPQLKPKECSAGEKKKRQSMKRSKDFRRES
ncbi:hypothetical protein GGR51DRAFT_567363 [Nemania sp. FL0031]|nr:hypothetical protein GGR51DRAFT_567363 [Nemania sp. FL0031]